MSTLIAIKRAGGGVSIMNIKENAYIDECLKKWDECHTDTPRVSYREITQDLMPSDRSFRDAWTDDNDTTTIDINIDKAKEICLDKFRELRKPLLSELDIEYQKADEINDVDEKKIIVDKKQQLRDVTKLELPSDIDILKNYIPDILNGG